MGRVSVCLALVVPAVAALLYASIGAGWVGWTEDLAMKWPLEAAIALAGIAGAGAVVSGVASFVRGERSIVVVIATVVGLAAAAFIGFGALGG